MPASEGIYDPEFPAANMGYDPLYPPNPNENVGSVPSGIDPNVLVNPYDTYGNNQTPPMNIPLVQPPGAQMPPNQQPMPTWMRFAPPIVRAGFGGYRLAQRLYEMYKNRQASKQGQGQPGQPRQPGYQGPLDGYFSPAYLRSIGYEPGQGTGSLFPGGGPSVGPNDVGAYGVSGGGGSFFHDLAGGGGGPLPGSTAGLGSFGPGNLEGWSGMPSLIGRNHPLTQERFNQLIGWENSQGNALEGAKFSPDLGPITYGPTAGGNYAKFLAMWRPTGAGQRDNFGRNVSGAIHAGQHINTA